MDKRSKIALYVISAVILLMMIAEVTKPKPLNWRDSYSAADKIPLGCYVLFNELKTFSDGDVLENTESIFLYLNNKEISDKKQSLFIINGYVGLTEQDADALMDFVDDGNSVFLSSKTLYGNLADTLNLNIKMDYSGLLKEPANNEFTSPSQEESNRLFEDVIENAYITSVDTLNTTILGTMSIEDEDESHPNFIKTKFGENGGAFYIHTNPYAFTNYHILNGNEDYTATVLSYLPKQQIIWDNYYKSGRKIITSPLRYILASPALKWAFYISMFSLILFVIFKGKRTQRIIPVVEKLENTTVEFTQTIGELYYQHGDFTNIISKKIQYFLEFVRTKYFLDTNNLNASFIEKLALKSANTKEDSKAIVDYLLYLKSKTFHTETELVELNKKIETFTKNNF
ncbi:DUF4350 domain-containing protein [Winogradskyella haliclonae]|uniref:DUF4350 domain-containing protein n=1 Tax=Winogradskyella haliclonae TaxID=2048558 RepID=A0ABQ2BYP0_9FLAO|nr:DUF4350 domain-containing protein [Winogradskyella haliclonae]GGI57204.1 hypothetical protein GCM10011444_15130 [Winogradskyella haliclonae]